MYFNFIARIRNKYLIGKQDRPHLNIGFEEAKSIGLIVYDKDGRHMRAVKYLIDKLTEKGKSVQVLVLVDDVKKNPNYPFPHTTLTKKDLSWNGGFKSKELVKFILDEFDYMLVMVEEFRLPVETILIRSNAKCRVGFANVKYDHVLELMIKLPIPSGIDQFIHESLVYLPLLKSHAA